MVGKFSVIKYNIFDKQSTMKYNPGEYCQGLDLSHSRRAEYIYLKLYYKWAHGPQEEY